jgi:hypothetical protein
LISTGSSPWPEKNVKATGIGYAGVDFGVPGARTEM